MGPNLFNHRKEKILRNMVSQPLVILSTTKHKVEYPATNRMAYTRICLPQNVCRLDDRLVISDFKLLTVPFNACCRCADATCTLVPRQWPIFGVSKFDMLQTMKSLYSSILEKVIA